MCNNGRHALGCCMQGMCLCCYWMKRYRLDDDYCSLSMGYCNAADIKFMR